MIALCTLIALLPQEPKVATVQVPEPLVVLDASMADVDADGHGDLLLACRDERSGARTLQVHLRQAKGPAFVPTPSRTFPIDGSIVAFAFCDCDPRPGRELVLFGATAAAAVLPTQDGGLDYRELLRHPLVWPAAAPTRLVSLSEQARDLDGDGREDLLLPGPDQWTAWLQQTDGTFVARRLKLPRWRNRISDAVGGGDDGSISLRIPTGGSRGDSSTGTLLRTSARTPPCEVVDLDGDGHPQLVAFRNGAAFALDLRADAVVEDTPLPLPEDRLKLIDPSFDVQWPDVDGDGR
ncbi:MAG: VCBS repeat-containing protein, partial [Planctomycetes bacterium]|nr:VCBS repeat-containing protein [Planctomycetota bacterium]